MQPQATPEPASTCDEYRAQSDRFHAAHPEVAREFDRIALELIRRGYSHYGASAVMEILRWETGAGADGRARFKINRNFTAFYARTFAEKYPAHADFFRFREQRSKRLPASGRPEMTQRDVRRGT